MLRWEPQQISSIIAYPGAICADCYFLTNKLLQFYYSCIGVQRRKDRDEMSRTDFVTMALKRLQARAAAGVPDLDSAVVRSRRQAG